MKRFLSSVLLCCSLFLIGLFFFMPPTEAQDNVLPDLLNLPAPPPPNPFYRPAIVDRDEDFYDREKAPADDAPIDDLLDYWNNQSNNFRSLGYNPKPSAKSLDRVIAEIEKNPEKLSGLLNALDESRETAEFVKRLYDAEVSAKKFGKEWRDTVRRWLTYNSSFFSSELVKQAREATDAGEYVSNQDELLALARVDWPKAEPIVRRLYDDASKPISQVLAKWAFYKHALETNSTGDIEQYRDELKKVVEDRKATDGMRDLALDALVKEKDWDGRDDWYFSLLEDETLAELRVNGQVYTGLTTIIYYAPADRYLEKMIELLKSPNPNVRSAVVRNLGLLLDRTKSLELVRAMLPWLEDPKWAKEAGGERHKLVSALQKYQIPESVPGLIAMLGEAERQTVSMTSVNSNMAVNRPAANANAVVTGTTTRVVYAYPYRSAAILALEKQKSPLAAGPLRQLLTAVENWERPAVVRALLACHGYTIAEQIDALEEMFRAAGRLNLTNTANVEIDPSAPVLTNTPFNPENPGFLKISLATQVTALEDPGDELIKAIIDRIGYHEKRNPMIAENFRGVLRNWKGPAVNALHLRDLRDGKTNPTVIVKLLVSRKELREKQLADVTDIRRGTPTALGVSACLLEETNDYDAILDGAADEAKAALLACARLIRAPLPVPKVAPLLKSPNKRLALAAERYLEAEDSPEARRRVLAEHPDEARILGARVSFLPGDKQPEYAAYPPMQELFATVDANFRKFPLYYFYGSEFDDSVEKKLQKEVRETPQLLGVYAYNDNFVRIYGDRAVFSWQDDPARYRERALTAEEFELLKNYLVNERVDELPPFLSPCDGCEGKELLMLGKSGGRRVFFKADPKPPFFAELDNIFNEFRRSPARIRYHLEKKVGGLEVLFADDNLRAQTLWKNGADFRLLIDDLSLRRQNERESEETEETETPTVPPVTDEMPPPDPSTVETEETEETDPDDEKTRRREQQLARQKEYGSLTWYGFDKTRLLEPLGQPAGIEYIPLVDGFAVQPIDQQWKARGGGVEIRTDQDGLYKVSRGQLTKIRAGVFYKPLVTPNGRWVVVSKYSETEDDYGASLVRINLATDREIKIAMPEEGAVAETVAFLPALNKVLLFSSYGEGEEPGDGTDEREGDFFLLDPETGVVRALGGAARPLFQQTFRPLQPAAAAGPDLFWTALPDSEKNVTEIGIFNAKTLVFKPLLTIPEIVFGSMNMWIDEAENKIYFVYEGQLLALPLPKNR